jgi:hypothetical protein
MIISAAPWQSELRTLCDSLRASLGDTKDDFKDFEFERSLYYIAICLRKLNDTSLKPSGLNFYGWPLEGKYYAPRGAVPAAPWWFSVDANFEMTKPRQDTAALSEIVNMIIHSKFLDCSYSTYSIIVGSDRKDKAGSPFIFEFSCERFLEYCAKISAADYHLMPPLKSQHGAKA